MRSIRSRAARSPCLEAARNVACVGGEPIGLTDCLNFGNPEKAEVGWELASAIDGIAAACEALDVPVVSGNVSLYNETNGRAIHPTPVVGCVGLVEDVRRVPKGWRQGDVSARRLRLPGLTRRLGVPGALRRDERQPPRLDLEAEARLVAFLWRVAPAATLVHDASEGGLAVCLAEAARLLGLRAPGWTSATIRSSCSARSGAAPSSRARRTAAAEIERLRPS